VGVVQLTVLARPGADHRVGSLSNCLEFGRQI
jgi:hypothetical protein